MRRTHGVTHHTPDTCYGCKVLTVQLAPSPFQAHWNHAVGGWVTNQADLENQLKRLGDIQSERTGITARYEPIHPADLKASPPPEVAPSHLDRLVAHAEHGQPMHTPVDVDPSLRAELRNLERARQADRARTDAETRDLIDHAQP